MLLNFLDYVGDIPRNLLDYDRESSGLWWQLRELVKSMYHYKEGSIALMSVEHNAFVLFIACHECKYPCFSPL